MTGKIGTGHPDPAKDRTSHKRKRGVKTAKPMTLAHLIKEPLSNKELDAALEVLTKESDRGTAILGAALVEDSLTDALNAWLARPDDKDALYHAVGAPFGTMRNKTIAAYALGICDRKTRVEVDIIRNVRNLFSHTLRAIDFNHPDVAAFCDRLQPRGTDSAQYAKVEAELGPVRLRFVAACLAASVSIARITNKKLKEQLAAYHALKAARMQSRAEDI